MYQILQIFQLPVFSYRLGVYYGPPMYAPTHWECAWKVHNIAILLGTEIGQPLFQLTIAVDRFLAVNWFYWYLGSKKTYVPVVLGAITVSMKTEKR